MYYYKPNNGFLEMLSYLIEEMNSYNHAVFKVMQCLNFNKLVMQQLIGVLHNSAFNSLGGIEFHIPSHAPHPNRIRNDAT